MSGSAGPLHLYALLGAQGGASGADGLSPFAGPYGRAGTLMALGGGWRGELALARSRQFGRAAMVADRDEASLQVSRRLAVPAEVRASAHWRPGVWEWQLGGFAYF